MLNSNKLPPLGAANSIWKFDRIFPDLALKMVLEIAEGNYCAVSKFILRKYFNDIGNNGPKGNVAGVKGDKRGAKNCTSKCLFSK